MRDYVVQTHPCSEMIAKISLEARGFDVFLPTIYEEIRVGRNREKRLSTIAPLFPGYLFVAFDTDDDGWFQISSTKGVRCLLGRDGLHPTPLPTGAVIELQARYAAGEFVRRPQGPNINAGDRFTVTAGPFLGFSGVCKVSGQERIEVLLSTLWGAIKTELPSNFVTPVLDKRAALGV